MHFTKWVEFNYFCQLVNLYSVKACSRSGPRLPGPLLYIKAAAHKHTAAADQD